MQKAGSRRVATALRRQQAVDLRVAGATYEKIGTALGISKQAAYKLVEGALAETAKKTNEDAVKLRELDLMRVDALIVALWKNRSSPRNADSILRAMSRRAELLGLDAPKRAEVKNQVQLDTPPFDIGKMTDEELRQYRELVAAAQAR